MKTAKSGHDRLIIRLDPGDEIISSLEALCLQLGWSNAMINGIGSLENPLLAHYRIDGKKFSQKRLTGVYEVIGLQGNIAIFKDMPLAHIHVSLSNENMEAFGGHLVEGNCSATAELVLTKLDSDYQKQNDTTIGLKIWDLPEK